MYFIIKKDLYVQIDILSLADVFENYRNKGIENMNLILLIFYQHVDKHGKLV